MIAAKVAMDATHRTPRAECHARDPRVVSARRRACVGRVRKTARVAHEYPCAKKSHINSPSRNSAGSAATPRRESRRAAAGVHSRWFVARVTWRVRREVSSRARAEVPENAAF